MISSIPEGYHAETHTTLDAYDKILSRFPAFCYADERILPSLHVYGSDLPRFPACFATYDETLLGFPVDHNLVRCYRSLHLFVYVNMFTIIRVNKVFYDVVKLLADCLLTCITAVLLSSKINSYDT